MVPTLIQAMRLIGQALDVFEETHTDPGPWDLDWPHGGQLTLAGGIYIAALPQGWTVDYALADEVTDVWQDTTNTGGWNNPSSAVTNLGGGRYRFTLQAAYTPPVGATRQFNFQMS